MASCQERGKQPEKQLLAADTDEETDGEDFEAVRENKTLQEDSNGEDVDDETSSSGYNSAEEERVRKELQQIPFEVLERLRETDNSAALAVTTVKATRRGDGNDTSLSKKFKRENKNRPPEMSSKRPVPRFREVFEAPKRQVYFCLTGICILLLKARLSWFAARVFSAVSSTRLCARFRAFLTY